MNHEEKDTWKIWDQPLAVDDWQEQRYAAALRAFWSAEAARRQGKGAFRRYHQALLRERHQNGKGLGEPGMLRAVAVQAGLDLDGFERALGDTACLERLAEDHTRAEALDVFGTPTFVFPGAEPVYLKLAQVPSPEEGLDFWEVFHSTAAHRPYVLEIKRPH